MLERSRRKREMIVVRGSYSPTIHEHLLSMSPIYEDLAHFREHFAHLNGHRNGHLYRGAATRKRSASRRGG
jgi:hypothetical protein